MNQTPRLHFFICTNQPQGEPFATGQIKKCGWSGAESLRQKLKNLCTDQGKFLRINASGCLGQCEFGVAAVCYPEGQWYQNLAEPDLQKLSQELIELSKRP